MRFVISLTSVPRRFDTSLRSTIQAVRTQVNCPDIIVNLPVRYRKWGTHEVPAHLHGLANVTVNRTEVDYGPATKLLGALQFLSRNPGPTHVLTIDDDLVFTNKRHVDYLMRCSRIVPEAALTIGGIKLEGPPYRCDRGLTYDNRYTFVDLPAGYRCSSYPVRPLLESPLTFSLREELPDGVFSDDDIYFGILLSLLGIPLFALPSGFFSGMVASIGAGESAVAEHVAVDRKTNESEILSDAVERGLLVPACRRPRAPFGVARHLRLRCERLRTALPY